MSNMYLLTYKIIKEIEYSLSNVRSNFNIRLFKGFFDWKEDLLIPIGFLKLGIIDFFKPILKALILLLFIIITYFFLHDKFEISKDTWFLFVLTYLSIIAFAIPSRYAFQGVNNTHINKVINILRNNKILKIEEIEILEKNFDLIYNRTIERVNALRWILGTIWVFFMLLFKEKGAILINIIEILPYMIISILFVSIYKRGLEILFKTIQFSLNDYKLILNKNKKPLKMK